MRIPDLNTAGNDFVWKDGERMIAFGPSGLASLPAYLRAAQMERFVVLASERSVGHVADVISMSDGVVLTRPGRVESIAAESMDEVDRRPIVAVGGGRVIDAAKAIGAAQDVPVAAIPTTLSGAPMTAFHRLPAGYAGAARPIRPKIVIAVPALMGSQAGKLRTGSAMNALAHAVESIFVTTSSPVPRLSAQSAIELIFDALTGRNIGKAGGPTGEDVRRAQFSLGAIEAGYAVGATGYAVHHVLCQTIVRIAGVTHAPTYGVMLPYTLEFLKIRDEVAWEMVSEAAGVDNISTEIARICAAAGLPTSLSALGVAPERIDSIVAEAEARPELALTPGGADAGDLRALLEAAF